MENYISKIAKTYKQARFDAILRVLTEHGIDYTIQALPNYGSLGNIIVTMNPEYGGGKTAVTAHYDNVPNMPGANDNAAACSILLNLIIALKENGTDQNLEFVFFDMEESGFIGSRYYCNLNRRALRGVVNLDMCGMGSHIVVSLHNGAEKEFSLGSLDDVVVLKMLPPGDAHTFINAGIPTVYVINSTDRDLAWFREYAKGGFLMWDGTDFARTMHKPTDTPDTCNLEQMEKITRWVSDIIL